MYQRRHTVEKRNGWDKVIQVESAVGSSNREKQLSVTTTEAKMKQPKAK